MEAKTKVAPRVSAKERERQEAITRLREWVTPGATLTTVLRHRSASGMYRAIDVYLFTAAQHDDGTPWINKRWLSALVARALGYRFDEKREAVGISGCGMDMGFEIVYNLSRVLFKDTVPTDAGYVLKHEWL